jgi:16S rRNA (guanine1207-N2)-methyltransferase
LKTTGIESFYKECGKRFPVSKAISKAHGKLFCFSADDAAGKWAADADIAPVEGFETVAGVFSAGKIDAGSRALVRALPDKLPKRIADPGAGWGYLSRHILERETVREVHLIEADHAALECAKRNCVDPRAVFHWQDATGFVPDIPFDAVVMNPPFHVSRNADPDIGRGFITAAAGMLKPAGQLWMVANRHLPYERSLAQEFLNVEEIAGDRSFKILHASRPVRHSRKSR